MKGLFTVSGQGGGRDFGIGCFPARLESFELLRGPYGPVVHWWFAVAIGDETVRLPWETGTAVTRGSRLAHLFQALGQPLPPDDEAAAEVDPSAFLGAACQVHLDRRYEEEGSRQVVSCIATVTRARAHG
jgi:hypothetical protein